MKRVMSVINFVVWKEVEVGDIDGIVWIVFYFLNGGVSVFDFLVLRIVNIKI